MYILVSPLCQDQRMHGSLRTCYITIPYLIYVVNNNKLCLLPKDHTLVSYEISLIRLFMLVLVFDCSNR